MPIKAPVVQSSIPWEQFCWSLVFFYYFFLLTVIMMMRLPVWPPRRGTVALAPLTDFP